MSNLRGIGSSNQTKPCHCEESCEITKKSSQLVAHLSRLRQKEIARKQAEEEKNDMLNLAAGCLSGGAASTSVPCINHDLSKIIHFSAENQNPSWNAPTSTSLALPA